MKSLDVTDMVFPEGKSRGGSLNGSVVLPPIARTTKARLSLGFNDDSDDEFGFPEDKAVSVGRK